MVREGFCSGGMENSLKDVKEQSRQIGGRRAVFRACLSWGGARRPEQSKAKGVGSEGGHQVTEGLEAWCMDLDST